MRGGGRSIGVQSIGNDDLGAHQGAKASGPGSTMEARRTAHAIAIGHREARMTQGDGRFDEVFRVAAGFEEGECAARAQLDKVLGGDHAIFSSYFRLFSIPYLLHSLLPSRL